MREEQLNACEAVQLASEGSTCDIDTVDGARHTWVKRWLDEGGDPAKLTISSDASKSSPMKFSNEVRGLVTEHGMSLDVVHPLVTTNTAIVCDPTSCFEVIGEGAGYVIDGQDISYTNLTEEETDRTLSAFGMHLHVLSMGDRFAMVSRQPEHRGAEALEKEVLGK